MRPATVRGQLIAVLALTVVAVAGAQEQSTQFFDRVDVHVVSIEAMVTDREGNAVTGLTVDDFEVFEDGTPVTLTNFRAVEGRQLVRPSSADQGTDAEPSETFAAVPWTRRLNLIVAVDEYHLRPENRNLIFEYLRRYLKERLDVRDRVMLVRLGDRAEVVQEFTNDQDLLLAAIDGLAKRSGGALRIDSEVHILLSNMQKAHLAPNPGDNGGRAAELNFVRAEENANKLAGDVRMVSDQRFQNVLTTVSALGRFSESLAGMEGRKAILFVSDGPPMRAANSIAQAWLNKFQDWVMRERVRSLDYAVQDLSLLINSSWHDASWRFRDLIRTASIDRVAFYPISNSSRLVSAGISAEFGGSGTISGQGAVSPDVVSMEQADREGSLFEMAGGTGGVAFTQSVKIGDLLDRIVDDYTSFYSLGYSPDHGPDGEFHRVEVRLKHPGLRVRHFEGYEMKDSTQLLGDRVLSAAHYDLTDNRLDIRLQPLDEVPVDRKRFQVAVLVKLPSSNLLLLPEGELLVGRATLLVTVRDAKSGGLSPMQRIDVPIEFASERLTDEPIAIAYGLTLNMSKGEKRIAVGVRDDLSLVDATTSLEITVGDGSLPQGPVPVVDEAASGTASR